MEMVQMINPVTCVTATIKDTSPDKSLDWFNMSGRYNEQYIPVKLLDCFNKNDWHNEQYSPSQMTNPIKYKHQLRRLVCFSSAAMT